MKKLVVLGCGLLIVLLSSCKDTATNPNQGSSIVFPDSNVSYGTHVQPLFDQQCAFTGCHGSDTYSSRGFSLDSYDHLMYGTRPVVVRGAPELSPLVWRIEGRPGTGPRMPFGLPPLNDNQIRGIRTWIGEGAQNN